MVSALQAFLIEASKELKKDVEVNLGGRLAEQKFIVRGLTLEEVQTARKNAIVTDATGKERQSEIEVTRQVIIAGCLEPDFSNAEFIKDVGCVTPSQVIDKVLLAGEATRLAKEIMKASGLGEDINKAVEEAKN